MGIKHMCQKYDTVSNYIRLHGPSILASRSPPGAAPCHARKLLSRLATDLFRTGRGPRHGP